MKLPSFRRIITQDFAKEDQNFVEQLGSTINDSFNTVYQALNKRITFKDNISATVKVIQITLNSDGTPTALAKIALDVLNTPVIGVVALNPRNLSTPGAFPTGGISVSYEQNGNELILRHLTGLPTGQVWQLTIIAIN